MLTLRERVLQRLLENRRHDLKQATPDEQAAVEELLGEFVDEIVDAIYHYPNQFKEKYVTS